MNFGHFLSSFFSIFGKSSVIFEDDSDALRDCTSYLQIKLLSKTAIMPTYGSVGAIGMDLYADEDVVVGPNCRKSVSLNIAVAVPDGYYGRIAPRSGLSINNGINVLGGVIDADYRGEIKVILHNTDSYATFTVTRGMRIAQFIMEMADTLEPLQVQDLPFTARGENGLGSTGLFSASINSADPQNEIVGASKVNAPFKDNV